MTNVREQLDEAKSYAVLGGAVGTVLFPLADYLDGGGLPLHYSAGIGLVFGSIVGEGVGLLVNAGKEERVAPLTVALPMLTTGGTMASMKLHPRTRSLPYKSLIGFALVGGIAGLLTGIGIETLQNR